MHNLRRFPAAFSPEVDHCSHGKHIVLWESWFELLRKDIVAAEKGEEEGGWGSLCKSGIGVRKR